jgi:hypothetical protein
MGNRISKRRRYLGAGTSLKFLLDVQNIINET